jgi:hypothetical protein
MPSDFGEQLYAGLILAMSEMKMSGTPDPT